ncbi:PAS domain S-box protein [Ancylothrix sp. C2]|uniref:PAS domain S-box protein n=1 Tax=Ancylothrix sp. D3o TaxID=2953691 RepID=UPI0021BB7581|nr:PAS domain S-box protein [Ancylothrix sp. D3o]MCT7951234.1 PAS domain S-box protein [Ancylothrix sp. D3o]
MLNNTTWQSEESFRLLVEGVRDYAIFMLDTTGNIVSWNAGAERIMGYQANTILGKNLSQFYLQQDTDSGKPHQELQLASLVGSCEDEGVRIRQDGSPFWASVLITSLKEEDSVIGFSVIVHDLTERKLIEEELCHANRFLRLLCDCNQALVRAKKESELLTDICRLIVETGKYSACSVELLSLDHEKYLQTAAKAGNQVILKQAENLQELPQLISVALGTGAPGIVRNSIPQNPGTPITFKLGSAIVLPLTKKPSDSLETHKNETNTVFGVITIYSTLLTAFDPQEIQLLKELADDLAYGIMALRSREFLKATETALRQSEERYRYLVELLPESVMVQEAGRISFINPAGLKLFGAKTPAQLLGQPVLNFVALDSQETAKQRIQTCQETCKESPFIEEKLVRLDGSEVFVESAGISLGGSGQGLLVVSRDLSERKQMEAALRQSEELYRLTLSNISEAVLIADKAGNLTYISPNIDHIFETAHEQLLKQGNIRHLLGENFLTENALETSDNHNIEREITTPSGKNRTLLVSVKQVAIGTGTVLYTCRDISDYKQARVALKENEELLTQMLESLPVGVWFSDPQGKICQVNRAGREIWGGVRYVAPEEYGEYKAWWASTGQPITQDEWPLSRAVLLGETSLNEVINIETFDGKHKTVLNSALPLRKPNGEILGALSVNQDITELRQIQEALFESNRRIAKILESITDGFFALDHQKRVSFVNSHGEYLLQKTRAELLGKTLCDVFPDAVDSIFLKKCLQTINTSKAENFEGFYKPLNRWFEVHAYPGEEGLAVYFQDITERKQAREALVESAHQLQAIFEAALDAMLIVNDTGHYVTVNPAAGALFNAPTPQIIGHHIADFLGEQEFNFDQIWENFKAQGRITGEMRICCQNGTLKDVDYSAVANFLPGRHLFVIRDITERKCTERELKQYREQLEELVAERTQELTAAMEQLNAEIAERSRVETALRASEEQLRTLINSTPDIICFKDANGRWLLANEAISQLFELGISELIGKKDTELAKLSNFYHDCFLLCDQTDEAAWNYKKLSRAFEAIPTSKGETQIYDVIKVPLFESDGTRKGLVVLGRDITQLQRAQEELGRLASIVESSDDAIIGTSPEGIILSWNAGAEEIYGYSAAEVKGRNCSILAQPDYPQEMQQILERINAGDRLQHYETTRIKKDGQPINVSLTISPIFDEQGKITGISRIARDITQQKRIETALERLRHQNELILASAGEGICGLDALGNIAFVNPAASRMLGYESKELLGQSVHILLQFTQTYERRCRIFASLEDGSVHHVTDEMFCHKSGRYFPVEYVSTPIRERNQITGAVITFKDITERLAMERMKDEFISMVSHELRTPLTSIRGSMGLLASGILIAQPEKAQRMLQIAVSNTDRLVRLINDILDLERIESGKINIQKQICNAGDLMREAAEDLQLMAQKAGVTLEVDPLPVQLWADSDRIVQTLTNLLSNAIKFSPAGSTVWLTGTPPSQGQVTICVRDQGRGIPREKLEMIFERFQQVDASDSRQKGGTGLGLAICRSIVQQHEGRIWAESTLGEGSCFCFSLPVDQANNPNTSANC